MINILIIGILFVYMFEQPVFISSNFRLPTSLDWETNIVRNVSVRSKHGLFLEQQPSPTTDASASGARCEREIKRDRTRRAEPFRGWIDERIVNSIYRTPQIRLTSSLTIKMIVDPLDRVNALNRRRIAASAFHLLSISSLRTSLSQKYSFSIIKRCQQTSKS